MPWGPCGFHCFVHEYARTLHKTQPTPKQHTEQFAFPSGHALAGWEALGISSMCLNMKGMALPLLFNFGNFPSVLCQAIFLRSNVPVGALLELISLLHLFTPDGGFLALGWAKEIQSSKTASVPCATAPSIEFYKQLSANELATSSHCPKSHCFVSSEPARVHKPHTAG